MRTLKLMTGALLFLAGVQLTAQEPAWNPAAIKECDRACLVGIMDGYPRDASRCRAATTSSRCG